MCSLMTNCWKRLRRHALEEAGYFDSVHRAMFGCLERLRAADRELIFRRYGQGLSVQDLATSTGRTVEAIYKSLKRTRVVMLLCVERALKKEDRD